MRIHGLTKTAAGVILLASALLAAGCGGGGKSTTTAKAGASARSSASAGGKDAGGSGAFCATANNNLKGARAVIPRDPSDPGQLKRYGQYIKSADAAARNAAPPEIAADTRLTTRVGATTVSFRYDATPSPMPTT